MLSKARSALPPRDAAWLCHASSKRCPHHSLLLPRRSLYIRRLLAWRIVRAPRSRRVVTPRLTCGLAKRLPTYPFLCPLFVVFVFWHDRSLDPPGLKRLCCTHRLAVASLPTLFINRKQEINSCVSYLFGCLLLLSPPPLVVLWERNGLEKAGKWKVLFRIFSINY